MVDQVRSLLLNCDGSAPGYTKVADTPSDNVMRLFGVSGECADTDATAVDLVLPLAMAPDLSIFRKRFDSRTTPPRTQSVYRWAYTVSLDGLYDRVLGERGRWTVSSLFSVTDPSLYPEFARLREASMSDDSTYALGAVLLACALRRLVLQQNGRL